jgi:hypothetical protein
VAVRLLIVGGVLAMLAGLAVALSVERPRLAGTNNVFDRFPNVALAPGQRACAQAEPVPGGTAAVRVHAEPTEDSTGGPIRLRLLSGGTELARGSRPGGWRGGDLDVPVRPVVTRTRADVDLCFTNRGRGPIALWGYGAVEGAPQRAVVEGEPLNERIRLTYLRAGRESGWDIVGAVAHRMGIGRGGWLDGWAFFGWLTALGATFVGVALALLRELRS